MANKKHKVTANLFPLSSRGLLDIIWFNILDYIFGINTKNKHQNSFIFFA